MKSKHMDLTQVKTETSLHDTGLTDDDIETETDKAILVNVKVKVWLPKSQVKMINNTIHLPAWLAKKLPE